jgi:hypothetical protein
MSFKPVYTINFKHLVKLFKKKRRSSIVHFMLSFSKSHNDVELLKTLLKKIYCTLNA